MERYCEFEISQTICTAIYCLSAAVLILINLIGGLYLLATLRALGNHQRVVPQHTPLVAPLQPFKTGPSPLYVPEEGSNGSATLASPDPEQQKRRGSAGSEAWGKQASAPSAGLKKLQWDVTLFFLAVVPMSLLFMGWSIFASRNFVLVLTRPGL